MLTAHGKHEMIACAREHLTPSIRCSYPSLATRFSLHTGRLPSQYVSMALVLDVFPRYHSTSAAKPPAPKFTPANMRISSPKWESSRGTSMHCVRNLKPRFAISYEGQGFPVLTLSDSERIDSTLVLARILEGKSGLFV